VIGSREIRAPRAAAMSASLVDHPALLPLRESEGPSMTPGLGVSPLGVLQPSSPGVGTPTQAQPSMVWPPTPSPVASSYHPRDFNAEWPRAAAFAPHTEAENSGSQMLFCPMQKQVPTEHIFWLQQGAPVMGREQMSATAAAVHEPVPWNTMATVAVQPAVGPCNDFRAHLPVMPQGPPPPAWTPESSVGTTQIMSAGVLASMGTSSVAPITQTAADAAVHRQSGSHLAANVTLQQSGEAPKAALGSDCQPADEQKLPSMGSALHGTGKCSPCAWFWKPRGCASGTACDYCHLCPAGELKSRRKAKVELIRRGILEPRESPDMPDAKQESVAASRIEARASRYAPRRGRRV
jgi:hypothetical protein